MFQIEKAVAPKDGERLTSTDVQGHGGSIWLSDVNCMCISL